MVKHARIKIKIDGELRPYTDGEWVVFNDHDFPIGFMRVEYKHINKRIGGDLEIYCEADPLKAWRDFWAFSTEEAKRRALERGYRIELVTQERMRELLTVHLGKAPATVGTGEETGS